MQLELLELTIAGLILIPLVILAILHLLDFSKAHGRAKMTAIYGFLTFILIFSYFTLVYFTVVDVSIIIIIYGTGLIFLPVWTLSHSKPDWLESWKMLFAILFLVVWAVYVIPRIFTALNFVLYFLAIVFALSIIFLLPGLMNDFKRIVLILGLALFYLERAWTLFDPITEALILVAGLWLVFIWYLLNKRSS
ncbi:MAG: hypothetical protein AM326_10410 [Candidatus Thorarchaeota archaeon SMTZ-45]|nr:MAG: hypothetical protein AM325_09045 [Candidatus Thorarchaeota archaeon SMTZ1-45]KXH73750.1 MAG: hypothetical protein AM326_10410 [Candidatus Thorarchaeota archaeon SMTZ-45]